LAFQKLLSQLPHLEKTYDMENDDDDDDDDGDDDMQTAEERRSEEWYRHTSFYSQEL
jgi:hypothetical protein